MCHTMVDLMFLDGGLTKLKVNVLEVVLNLVMDASYGCVVYVC